MSFSSAMSLMSFGALIGAMAMHLWYEPRMHKLRDGVWGMAKLIDYMKAALLALRTSDEDEADCWCEVSWPMCGHQGKCMQTRGLFIHLAGKEAEDE